MRPPTREFFNSSVTAACAASLGGGALADSLVAGATSKTSASPPTLSLKKGVWYEMLPAKLSTADRFKMVTDSGADRV